MNQASLKPENPADIGLQNDSRVKVVGVLNRLLSDEVLLYVKTRNYHWNIEGKEFLELHKFLEEQYELLDQIMDDVAERARSIDGRASGSMNAFMKQTRLQEDDSTPNARQMIANLLADNESLIRHLREDISQVGEELDDAGTEDFLTGVMEIHEKKAWMMRSYLRGRAD